MIGKATRRVRLAHRAVALVALSAIALAAGACGAQAPTPTPSTEPGRASFTIPPNGDGFKLVILKKTWDQALQNKYTWADAWAVLETISLDDPVEAVGDGQIESYDWTNQTVTLTRAASEAFAPTFASSAPSGQLVAQTLFVVTLNGARLYGGMFLSEQSAMGIKFPVIYLAGDSEHLELAIRPSHSGISGYSDIEASLRARIEIPQVRAHFEQLGKLTQ